MSGLDTATWQALGLVLTLLGLGASTYVWSRRGPARGLRAVAWSLIPLAAALTGTLRLVGDVVGAFGRWSSRLVLDPLTWTGIAVAGVSAVLFLLSGRLIGRDPRPARRGRAARRQADAAGAPAGAGPGAATPAPDALGSRATAPAASPPPARGAAGSAPGPTPAGAGTGDPDLDEIEAILRRRGIT
ncbi:cellulose synthase [Nocardioides sp. HDW12B]|uniref:cellulose synthase n=1 Tax=Nocardioides sp. HDW12B TaxID=2714939 RepID=UPI00140AE9D6|nr:cellulose synthase [Nocardioides sp. HDW12B]QIK66585.1 cellulose synthase [Nocardioides sp. HDW12B]